MKDIHDLFRQFKEEFPLVDLKCEELGKAVHEEGGPLKERERWLMKVAISGAAGHMRSLEVHIKKAQEAGATEDEIKHTLLLLISTAGFPTFMEAYSVYKGGFTPIK